MNKKVVPFKLPSKIFPEKTDTPTRIIAEVYYQPYENAYVQAFLLGEDNQLYRYNDLWHTIRPFSQKSHLRYPHSPQEIKTILEHSKIEKLLDRTDSPGKKSLTQIITNPGYQRYGHIDPEQERNLALQNFL